MTMMFAKLGLKNAIHKSFFSKSSKRSFGPTFSAYRHQQPVALNCVLFAFNRSTSLSSGGSSLGPCFTACTMYCNICRTPNSQTDLIIQLDGDQIMHSQVYWSIVRNHIRFDPWANSRSPHDGTVEQFL